MNNIINRIKNSGNKPILAICTALMIITAGINLYGYFHLPDKIATQIGFNGEYQNQISTQLYLVIVLIVVIFISVLTVRSEKENQHKWLFTDILIGIANIVMIILQS
jgi:uncharacterized membrane protein